MKGTTNYYDRLRAIRVGLILALRDIDDIGNGYEMRCLRGRLEGLVKIVDDANVGPEDRIREVIDLYGRFSIAEIADTADLPYSQVKQAVQQFIKQGYVRPLGDQELYPAETAHMVGRQRYTLTEEATS